MTDFRALCEELVDALKTVAGLRPRRPCPLGAAMTKQLSPAAQMVDRAIADRIQLLGEIAPSRQVAAAALRAAADQAHPKAHIEDINYVHQNYVDGWKDALDVILAIADELEAQ